MKYSVIYIYIYIYAPEEIKKALVPCQEPASEYVEPRVSPYRLAAHLTSAFVIYTSLLWNALSVVMPEPPAESVAWTQGAARVKRLALPVACIVGLTAVSGAFVAGNDAVCKQFLFQ